MLRSAVLIASALSLVFAETPGLCQAPPSVAPTQATWELGRSPVSPEKRDGSIDDPALVGYGQQLVDQIAAAAGVKPVRVRLTRSAQEYALLLSGKVLYLSGALTVRLEDEAQFAGLVAHELAHEKFVDHSCALAFPQATSWPDDQRGREMQATASAMSVLKIAGYDPEPVLTLLSKLAYEHPDWGKAISPDDLLQLRLPFESETAPQSGYRLDSSAFIRFQKSLKSQLGKPNARAASGSEWRRPR